MTHEMKLQREPFEIIKSGKKTVELRLYDEKRSRISIGDTVAFSLMNEPENRIFCTVTEILRFPDFKALYESIPQRRLGYSDTDTVSYLDMQKYYPEDEQKRFGVVAFGIKLCV